MIGHPGPYGEQPHSPALRSVPLALQGPPAGTKILAATGTCNTGLGSILQNAADYDRNLLKSRSRADRARHLPSGHLQYQEHAQAASWSHFSVCQKAPSQPKQNGIESAAPVNHRPVWPFNGRTLGGSSLHERFDPVEASWVRSAMRLSHSSVR